MQRGEDSPILDPYLPAGHLKSNPLRAKYAGEAIIWPVRVESSPPDNSEGNDKILGPVE